MTEWDLTPLFTSDDDPKMEAEKKEVEEESYKFINKWKNRDDYLKDPKILREALDEYEKWSRIYGTAGKIDYYFWLRTSQDQISPELKAKENKVNDFGKKIANDIQFFVLRLGKVDRAKQQEFLRDKLLRDYHHFLERLFVTASHKLGEEAEKVETLRAQGAYGNWTKTLKEFLSKEERRVTNERGKKELMSFEKLRTIANDAAEKNVRAEAAKAFSDILAKHSDLAQAEMNSVLEYRKVDDSLRGFNRPDEYRHIGDDLESNTVDALVGAVAKSYGIPNRFYKLKTRLLGVRKLAYYEKMLAYGKIRSEYSFEEAVNLISRVFTDLDAEFATIFEEFVRGGHFDVYPHKGKHDGAFCVYWLQSTPVFILLNHTDKLQDVLTIAHETGHGINDMLMKKQNGLNYGTPLSTAEVASTFMEDFVLQKLLAEADEEARLALMVKKLDEDMATIFRQISFYQFEQEMHRAYREKGYLAKKEIGDLFKKHMDEYLGGAIDTSQVDNWWIYVSHFRTWFYVYSYVSGLLISKAMQNEVKKKPSFILNVKEFLSAGLSDSPKNIFMKMGIDISDPKFWDKGIREVESLLTETETLAKKLGKI